MAGSTVTVLPYFFSHAGARVCPYSQFSLNNRAHSDVENPSSRSSTVFISIRTWRRKSKKSGVPGSIPLRIGFQCVRSFRVFLTSSAQRSGGCPTLLVTAGPA
jgi:hypothetical protein